MHITDSQVLVLPGSSDSEKAVQSFFELPSCICVSNDGYSHSTERTVFREMIFTPVITTHCSHLGIEVWTCEDTDYIWDYFRRLINPLEVLPSIFISFTPCLQRIQQARECSRRRLCPLFQLNTVVSPCETILCMITVLFEKQFFLAETDPDFLVLFQPSTIESRKMT